ncbi:MAG: DUF2334 domain-containing protein [Sarcina sp.]
MKKVKLKKRLWKRVRNVLLGTIGVVVTVYIGSVCYYRLSMIKDIRVEDGKVVYKQPHVTRDEHIKKQVELTHIDEVKEVKDVKFEFNGKPLNLEGVVEQYQRYYFSLEDFLNGTGRKFTKADNVYDIEGVRLDLANKNFLKSGTLHMLRGDLIDMMGETYISLNDLEHILSLGDTWDHEKKTVSLFKQEKEIAPIVDRNTLSGKGAMIRLEDVRPGDRYVTNEGIQSMKATVDYLYENGVVFNVAWISRFKDPGKKIDNDLMVDEGIENVQFVNMLDHILYRGGVIGLHGYTHQAGQYTSGIGSDLSTEYNSSEEETRELVEAAFETAKYLKIPVSFFESGHYHATKKQQAIIEEYIDACFEPYKIYWNFQPVVSKRNDATIYVPAPLLYTKEEDGSDMAEKIRRNKNIENILTAFYLHPTKEMDYFKFTEGEDGVIKTEHLPNSPLQNIVGALKDSGHVTITINDLK